MSWGSDETVDFYEAREATIQWSTIEESGLYGHSEGEHNYGLINGPGGGPISPIDGSKPGIAPAVSSPTWSM